MHVFRVREYKMRSNPTHIRKMKEKFPIYEEAIWKLELDEEWRAQEFADSDLMLNDGWIYFFADLTQDL